MTEAQSVTIVDKITFSPSVSLILSLIMSAKVEAKCRYSFKGITSRHLE